MRFQQQMNLLKKKVDEVIILKEAQIAEEDSFVNFDFENSMSFLHLGLFI